MKVNNQDCCHGDAGFVREGCHHYYTCSQSTKTVVFKKSLWSLFLWKEKRRKNYFKVKNSIQQKLTTSKSKINCGWLIPVYYTSELYVHFVYIFVRTTLWYKSNFKIVQTYVCFWLLQILDYFKPKDIYIYSVIYDYKRKEIWKFYHKSDKHAQL